MKPVYSHHLSAAQIIGSDEQSVDERLIDNTIRVLLDEEVSPPEQQPDLVQDGEAEPEPVMGRPRQTASDRMRRLLPDGPPRWRVSLAILVLAILIGWPILFLVFFCLLLALLVVPYLTIGHDRAMEIAAQGYDLLSRYSPRHAEQLRDWAVNRTTAMEQWLSYLPERWTDGLYLPDFESGVTPPEKMQTDPFDRLYDRLHRQDAEL
ncbi:hypothetical protein [Ruegeria marina]|uniref:Uncharacterized protein n=1 Tax=Ruegeria marina TaxID=639004 RepID=A0A1G6M061_9RHOB|nr:hypothetical protein [Ruegeria marina]SDC48375.1 hypothetical protein SAMN04488239_102359 [Ruegeria marina]